MLKKSLLTALCLFGFTSLSQATITISLDAGLLKTALGAANVPTGALLQIITSPSGSIANFTSPSATSFVTGDNLVVASFAMNYNAQAGETINVLSGLTLQNTGAASPTTFDAGDPLLLRWYPTLTTSSTTPGLGTTFGQFRTDTAGAGGAAWITPANGGTVSLALITVSAGGTSNATNAQGYASSVVTNVPEPSTMVILGGAAGFAGFLFMRCRRVA